MKAIIRTKAGKNFSTMKVENIPTPVIQSDEIKVKMISSRINPVDMDLMKGMPFLKYKNPQIGGIDGAGIVMETGSKVSNFQVGDTVFFYRKFSDIGTWAEEISIKASDCSKILATIDTKDAGAIALPLLTAYESLQQFHPQQGEKILIHGVGGGVGFQALLIAKKMGLYVVGTASSKDKEFLKNAGLGQFIDYKTQDFATILNQRTVNYVFDLLGDETLMKSIEIQPEKIVSVRYVDPNKMEKVGIHLPGILKWIMKLTMRKFDKAAQKNKVELIGQVTGANGKLLQEAADFMEDNLVVRNYPTLTLTEIEKNGLNEQSVGKIIYF